MTPISLYDFIALLTPKTEFHLQYLQEPKTSNNRKVDACDIKGVTMTVMEGTGKGAQRVLTWKGITIKKDETSIYHLFRDGQPFAKVTNLRTVK